jgi:outer membrane protein assembly factor BamB
MSNRAAPVRMDLFDDVLYVHNSRNVVTAMETTSGANRWSNQLASPIARFVGSERIDDRILTASDNELFLLSVDTGEVLDRQDLALVVNTAPLVVGQMVVFGSTGGEALGHDLFTRHKRWGYQLRGAIEADPVRVGPGVGVVSQRGDVLIVEPRSGASLSLHTIFDGLTNDPVAGDDTLFIAGRDQSVWAFPAREDRTLWRLRTEAPIAAQPVFYDGLLLVTLPDRGFTAIDAFSGDVMWNAKSVSGRAVAIRDGRLLVWDGEAMAALDPDTGDVLTRAAIPDVAFIAFSDFEDGEMYTMSPAGVVSKLLPR